MKKYVMFGLFASVVTAAGMMGANALAESISSGPGSSSSGGISPMIININPNGRVLMRGVVESADTDSISVKSWGGAWEVKVSSTTEIISIGNVISDFQVGDFVGVLGIIVPDGSFVIDATIVREWVKKADHDHDGISDDQDGDDDNDGLSDDSDLKPRDHDNDSVLDDLDTDDDDDGILDANEQGKTNDHDDDGVLDSQDTDDDNDNISDTNDSKPHDQDNDGEDDDEDDDDSSGSNNSVSGSGN